MTHLLNEGGPHPVERTGPHSLARRVSGWTSNLLATGIVLAAALGVGRQLSHWWQVPPETVPAVGPGAVNDQGDQPFQLTFGQGYSLRRLELESDLDTAVDRLRTECRQILERGLPPERPPTDAERRFLARTLNRSPLEEHQDQWEIHQFQGKLPLLVAVLKGKEASGEAAARVLAWGLAMPTGEKSASLLIYEASGAHTNDPSTPAEVPLPAGLRRTVTIRGQGETSIGLAGDDSPQRTGQQLDALLKSHGWTATGWRQTGAAWHNRYQSMAARSGRIDVQLSDDGRHGVVGIMVLSP